MMSLVLVNGFANLIGIKNGLKKKNVSCAKMHINLSTVFLTGRFYQRKVLAFNFLASKIYNSITTNECRKVRFFDIHNSCMSIIIIIISQVYRKTIITALKLIKGRLINFAYFDKRKVVESRKSCTEFK